MFNLALGYLNSSSLLNRAMDRLNVAINFLQQCKQYLKMLKYSINMNFVLCEKKKNVAYDMLQCLFIGYVNSD